MAIKEIPRTKYTVSGSLIYSQKIEMDSGLYSDIYLIPFERVISISVKKITTNGFVQLSYSNPENNEIDFIFEDDSVGIDELPIGITAIRLRRLSETFIVEIIIKAEIP